MASRSSTPSNAGFWASSYPHVAAGSAYTGSSRGASPPLGYDSHGSPNPGGSSSALAAPVGVTRSRTLLFLSYRDSVPRSTRSAAGSSFPSLTGSNGSSYSRDDPLGASNASDKSKGKRRQGAYFDASGDLQTENPEAPLLLQRDAHAIDIPSLPPKWVDASDEVDGILNDLQPKIAQLDKLHSKHLLPGFVDRTQEERDIEILSGEITKEFRRASKLVASLATSTQALIKSGRSSTHEIAMAQNVQTALAQRVQVVSGQFRKKQSNYMQRLRGQDIRHKEVLGELGLSRTGSSTGSASGHLRDEELAVREDMELSKQHLSAANQQQQAQLLIESEETSQQDVEIQQRSNEIGRIAESIVELSTLFQDLQSLVITQGSLIDRIDYNIENMGQNMQVAAQELITASKTQKRTGRGQCILFLLLLCALLIAIIIIKPFWRFFFGGASDGTQQSTPVPTSLSQRQVGDAPHLLGFSRAYNLLQTRDGSIGARS